jgi:NADP-reducing hydrogenase subunit HndD
METINMKINGIEVKVPAGSTILEAAEIAGIRIPTLCYMKEINAIGACRMCVVEVKGARSNPAACLQVVSEGMEVNTNTPALRESRKKTMELLLSNHRLDCLGCVRSGNCEFQQLSQEYGCDPEKYAPPEPLKPDIDDSAIHLIRDNSKCILCRRCVAVCKSNQHVHVIGANERGFKTHIGSAFDLPLANTSCVNCGQCIAVCRPAH